MNFQPNMLFLNRSFDKKRLKALLFWFRLNLSEGAALKAVEILQGLGFRSATQGAISLGLDDLKTPTSKGGRVFQAQLEVALARHEHHRGNRTPVELFQHLVDTWHRTSQDLTTEVVQLFHSTERVNPVYMMAFSGARGNISQVRQLVGMRGLMADPRGQIVGFPILSNFREGLTITEYFVSCYGARKGVVDTAIRTADAGYLTRRLADVSHHVVVRTTNCGTYRSIQLKDIKEGKKTILSLANRLVGRVLAEHISISPSDQGCTKKIFSSAEVHLLPSESEGKAGKRYDSQLRSNWIAYRNSEITPLLASKLVSQCLEISVRSPLSCSLPWGVCQLCYGWGLSEGRRVTLGEAVGIIAAQSIGEPGTQLTLRTFHTGGVFSGELLNEIRAPFIGTVHFPKPLQGLLLRTPHGQIAFLAKISGKMKIYSIGSSYSFPSPVPFSDSFQYPTRPSDSEGSIGACEAGNESKKAWEAGHANEGKQEQFAENSLLRHEIKKSFLLSTSTSLFLNTFLRIPKIALHILPAFFPSKVRRKQVKGHSSSSWLLRLQILWISIAWVTKNAKGVLHTQYPMLPSDSEGSIGLRVLLPIPNATFGMQKGKVCSHRISKRKSKLSYIRKKQSSHKLIHSCEPKPLPRFASKGVARIDLLTDPSIPFRSASPEEVLGMSMECKTFAYPSSCTSFGGTKNKRLVLPSYPSGGFAGNNATNAKIWLRCSKKGLRTLRGSRQCIRSTYASDFPKHMSIDKSVNGSFSKKSLDFLHTHLPVFIQREAKGYLLPFIPREWKESEGSKIPALQAPLHSDKGVGSSGPYLRYGSEASPRYWASGGSKQYPEGTAPVSRGIKRVGNTNKSLINQNAIKNGIRKKQDQEFLIQPSTVLFVRQNEHVSQNQLLAEFSSSALLPSESTGNTNDQIEMTQQVLSETAGQVWFKEMDYGSRKGPGSGSLGTHFSSQDLGGIWVLAGKPMTNTLSFSDRQLFLVNQPASFLPILPSVLAEGTLAYPSQLSLINASISGRIPKVTRPQVASPRECCQYPMLPSDSEGSIGVRYANKKVKEVCSPPYLQRPCLAKQPFGFHEKVTEDTVGKRHKKENGDADSNLDIVTKAATHVYENRKLLPISKADPRFAKIYDGDPSSFANPVLPSDSFYSVGRNGSKGVFAMLTSGNRRFAMRSKPSVTSQEQDPKGCMPKVARQTLANRGSALQRSKICNKSMEKEPVFRKPTIPLLSESDQVTFATDYKGKFSIAHPSSFIAFSTKKNYTFPAYPSSFASPYGVFAMLTSGNRRFASHRKPSGQQEQAPLLPLPFRGLRSWESEGSSGSYLRYGSESSPRYWNKWKECIRSTDLSSFASPYGVLAYPSVTGGKQEPKGCIPKVTRPQGMQKRNIDFNVFPGQFLAYGDNIISNIVTTESGQVLYIDSRKVTLRKAQTVLIYSQAIIAVFSEEWIKKGTPLMSLSYQKLVTGDIVQGLPKIEQFFEARMLKDGTFWSGSLQAQLNQFFQEYKEGKNGLLRMPLAEAVRKGFSEIQKVLVEGVQRVYISQGVLIADKHLEVIVRQMTCKGRILYSGDTGFLRNELVSLDKIENVNQVIYGQKALYHPQVRGITDASLESESFLSAASFQETTRVLSRDAIIGKTDLMRGLKERVIVGELIQAGTGLANNSVYSLI